MAFLIIFSLLYVGITTEKNGKPFYDDSFIKVKVQGSDIPRERTASTQKNFLIPEPFYDFYFKELQISNVRAAKGRDFTECIELVRRGKLNLGALITHTFPYTELNNAIRMLMEPSDERLKVILERV